MISAHFRPTLIFGANTDVGKTLTTAGLVRNLLLHKPQPPPNSPPKCVYFKPLQAGSPTDLSFITKYAPSPHHKTLFDFPNYPCSPHLASYLSSLDGSGPKDGVSDETVISTIKSNLSRISSSISPTQAHTTRVYVETAGGVLSPSSSSTLNTQPTHATHSNTPFNFTTQADMYKPLNLPVILVGDGRLGGVSCTLSAVESLTIRGYDIHAIVFVDPPTSHSHHNKHNIVNNAATVKDYYNKTMPLRFGSGEAFDPNTSVFSLPPIPACPEPLHEYYDSIEVQHVLSSIESSLQTKHEDKLHRLSTMKEEGANKLWWPFTQHAAHKDETNAKITLIDSAHGDKFSVISESNRTDLFDACASWWTQGVGHGDSSLALCSAAAAGRYGHVMFPDNVHEPALRLADRLVGKNSVGEGWAERVFYSDDGSTAMEVALKAALRLYATRHNQHELTPSKINPKINTWGDKNLMVLAQEDCYHGDTLGVMNVAVPSVWNENQSPWYQPKGLFLKTPTIGYIGGELKLMVSGEIEDVLPSGELMFANVDAIMDVETRLKSVLYKLYRISIRNQWTNYEETNKSNSIIGCVCIEPLLIGAGGMKFVDPLWQRALSDESKARNIPVIYDEIASGLHRVGVLRCSDILGVYPDIACYAKLLTGGLVPLAVTLTTEEVFSCFLGEDKTEALLHGHSYTAHPVGCLAGIHALDAYEKVFGMKDRDEDEQVVGRIRQKFDEDDVRALSLLPGVVESFALGTVLTIKLSGGTGYTASSKSIPVVQKLREKGVFARPLGNVVYVMTSPLTGEETCRELVRVVGEAVSECEGVKPVDVNHILV